MTYQIRDATLADIPTLITHREQMFRDMGISAEFDAMARAAGDWLRTAIPSRTYLGWLAVTGEGAVAAGGGLLVMPWPPGPITMDPRCAFIYNVYTAPAHRKQGLAKRLVTTMHDWCRAAGIERVALNASALGQPIYEQMGYVVCAEPMMRIRL